MLGNNVVGGSAGLAAPGGGRVRSNNSMTLLHYNMLLHCKQILHVGCLLDATLDYLSYQQSHDNYMLLQMKYMILKGIYCAPVA